MATERTERKETRSYAVIVESIDAALEKINYYKDEFASGTEPEEVKKRYLARAIARLGEVMTFVRDDSHFAGNPIQAIAKELASHRNRLLHQYLYSKYDDSRHEATATITDLLTQAYSYIEANKALIEQFTLDYSMDQTGKPKSISRNINVPPRATYSEEDYQRFITCCYKEVISLGTSLQTYDCYIDEEDFFACFGRLDPLRERFFLGGGLENYITNIATMIKDQRAFIRENADMKQLEREALKELRGSPEARSFYLDAWVQRARSVHDTPRATAAEGSSAIMASMARMGDEEGSQALDTSGLSMTGKAKIILAVFDLAKRFIPYIARRKGIVLPDFPQFTGNLSPSASAAAAAPPVAPNTNANATPELPAYFGPPGGGFKGFSSSRTATPSSETPSASSFSNYRPGFFGQPPATIPSASVTTGSISEKQTTTSTKSSSEEDKAQKADTNKRDDSFTPNR